MALKAASMQCTNPLIKSSVILCWFVHFVVTPVFVILTTKHMNIFGRDVAVSLVDDSFLFSTQTQASPLVLPAYVAIQTGTPRVLACGEEAKAMLGREPTNISVVRV